MKKLIVFWGIGMLLLLFSCSDTTKTNPNLATLQGTVYGLNTDNSLIVLPNALVSVANYHAQAHTDAQGKYEIQVELPTDKEQDYVSVEASKAGYTSAIANVTLKKGEITYAPDLTLKQMQNDTTGNDTTTVDTTQQSGQAAHIEVFGNHSQHIYVHGTGLTETARIDFLVTDAQGVPVDNDHKVKVHFAITSGPNGGEYLDPDTMTTYYGRVFTVLNSGIVAGPVQISASFTMNGQTIATTPIRIAIYGGLPDPNHFSLAAEVLNIAGLRFHGLLDRITAFVGDKYSNPVAPGTVVYFSTDYGIVDGSAVTDEMGRATIQFMTAAPFPPNPQDSAFAHITGWTYRDTLLENTITARTRVLLTDDTAPILVNPSSFTYDNSNTPVYFSYVVQDIWGRPLVPDTKIKVSATDGNLYGDTDIVLEDTQVSGPGSTEFSFSWAPGDSLQAPQVYINIKVTTPTHGNGYQSVNILGVKQ